MKESLHHLYMMIRLNILAFWYVTILNRMDLFEKVLEAERAEIEAILKELQNDGRRIK